MGVWGSVPKLAAATLLTINVDNLMKCIIALDTAVNEINRITSTAPKATDTEAAAISNWDEGQTSLKNGRVTKSMHTLMTSYTKDQALNRRRVTRDEINAHKVNSVPVAEFPEILQSRMKLAAKGEDLE